MTDFIPPKPKPHKRKLSPLRRILEVRHSSISVLFDRSYSMHLGDVWTPTRNVYFLNQPALVDRVLVKDAGKYPKSISMGSARIAGRKQRKAYIPFSAGPRLPRCILRNARGHVDPGLSRTAFPLRAGGGPYAKADRAADAALRKRRSAAGVQTRAPATRTAASSADRKPPCRTNGRACPFHKAD